MSNEFHEDMQEHDRKSKEPKFSKAGYWQQCPVCKGTGKTSFMQIHALESKCDVCNGKKIISTITGLPPL